jgi:hypothetical protein
MTLTPDPSSPTLPRSASWILIAVSLGMMVGRILAVDSVDTRALEKVRLEKVRADLADARRQLESQGYSAEQVEAQLQPKQVEAQRQAQVRRPFLSANDRSRWCSIRALVESDMQVPGAPYAIDRVIQEPLWDTIDMVKHDGHLYSSKPPLLATMLAGPYWLIHRVTGATLGTHPYEIGRAMLILVNVLPMAVYFWLLVRLAERFASHEWSRLLVIATAAFGTFLTTFAVVINNHGPAAVSVMVAIYAAVRIWFDGERRLRYFIVAGLCATFAAADELPSLSFLVPLGLALLWKDPRRTLLAFAPAVIVVTAAFLGTNWIAHRSIRPPYAHRSQTDSADNWYRYSYQRNGVERRSYWESPQGIDRGEPSRAVYALHSLIGHHGIFSLTPVWLLSVVGLALWLRRSADPRHRELALLIAAVSVVCLVFYLGVVGQRDRNYGGMTSGLRWTFWLVPMWLVAMLPAADLAARRRWSRGVALVLLALSVLSVSYPTWNPWIQPWLYNFMDYADWLPRIG